MTEVGVFMSPRACGPRMRIAVMGTGDVGRRLAADLNAEGHDVVMGTRDPGAEKLQGFLSDHKGIEAKPYDAAAQWCQWALLCTSWSGTEDAVGLIGPENLAGKTVIDVTNPLVFPEDSPPGLALGHTDSAGEQVQRWLPEAKVVKALNTVGNPHMVHPDFPGGPPTMFIGGHADAVDDVAGFLAALGWDVSVLGDITAARYLEPLAMVWILEYARTGSGGHALKMLRT